MNWSFDDREIRHLFGNASIPMVGTKELPPPLVDGQEIQYRLYNNAGGDWIVEAFAVGGQWVEVRSWKVPSSMVCHTRIPLEELARQASRIIPLQREGWLRERLVRLLGHEVLENPAQMVLRLCKAKGIKIERRQHPDHDELWVNGVKDSEFWPELKTYTVPPTERRPGYWPVP